jgi:hypothetical protein
MRTNIPSPTLLGALAASALFAAGCSSDTVQSARASDAPPKLAVRPASAEAPATVEEISPKSVFTVDKNARDPFFPKARPVEAEPVATTEVAFDVPAILQASLHGIISSGGKSIAYVSNTMLEEGREAVIPIRAGGQERRVNVRCVGVTRDTVVLEVQGYTGQIKLTRSNN